MLLVQAQRPRGDLIAVAIPVDGLVTFLVTHTPGQLKSCRSATDSRGSESTRITGTTPCAHQPIAGRSAAHARHAMALAVRCGRKVRATFVPLRSEILHNRATLDGRDNTL